MGNVIRVAAIQMVSTSDVEGNMSSARELIDQAADQGAKLVVLPEYWPIITSNDTDKLKYREDYGHGPLQEFLADQAGRRDIWLLGGTIPLTAPQGDRVYSSCLLFNPQGECTARYDKIHLFDVSVGDKGGETYRESDTIVPGNSIVVARTPFANIGMSVCYDLRFPELYRGMLAEDVTIITIPSAFTATTGRLHWEMLIRTRAVENLCYVIAPNQGGQHGDKRQTWGHSMIIDPWGDILGALETGSGVICTDLNLSLQEELRSSFPALKHTTLLQ